MEKPVYTIEVKETKTVHNIDICQVVVTLFDESKNEFWTHERTVEVFESDGLICAQDIGCRGVYGEGKTRHIALQNLESQLTSFA